MTADDLVDGPRVGDAEEFDGRGEGGHPIAHFVGSGSVEQGLSLVETDRTGPVAALVQLKHRQMVDVERPDFGASTEQDALVGNCVT